MNSYSIRSCWAIASMVSLLALPAAASADGLFEWSTVVNNGDYMPSDRCDPLAPVVRDCRTFNSYNQPSVNADGLVVFRARSRGGQGMGQPVHGIYSRDMATGEPVVKILDRHTPVPEPNNNDTDFIEPPSFPRIDGKTRTIATRGNHQPVWQVSEHGAIVEQLGTTGIYSDPFGYLLTGASKLGGLADFWFYEVPEAPGTAFDVFPGAPAVPNGNFIVFKGNYTLNNSAKTGVYYRHLQDAPSGGARPVVLIANNTDTLIPGTDAVFGSTAPPSAARNRAVFAGFDNENQPSAGGIYPAPLTPYPQGRQPKLKTLVGIGSHVPGEADHIVFNKLGEAVSFDGRFAAFWGAWGDATRLLRLYCPGEGNQARRQYCRSRVSDSVYDPEVDNWYQEKTVPVHQGIFVHDTKIDATYKIVGTGNRGFSDFVFWNFSGRAPGTGEGEEDGELARWRFSAFVAVSGKGETYRVAFKARSGVTDGSLVYTDPKDGIYLGQGPKRPELLTLVETGMDATALDHEAAIVQAEEDDPPARPLPITSVGLERDGFRGDNIVINAGMGSEDTGWAGIYLTKMR